MALAFKIGVLDSGAGGLTILAEIIKQAPTCDLHYFADDAFSPYGNLSTQALSQRTHHICDYLIQNGVNMLVVACNTATVETINLIRNLPEVKAKQIKVVGVEPAIKPAALLNQTQPISILATPATCQSERLQYLLEIGQHVIGGNNALAEQDFHCIASESLAKAIDDLPQTHLVVEHELKRIHAEMSRVGSNVLVLACTHYPLIRARFEAILGSRIQIIEPSAAVAAHVVRLFPESYVEVSFAELVLHSSGCLSQAKRLKGWLNQLLGEDLLEPLAIRFEASPLG